MCSMNRLSPKRAAILTFIRDRIAQQGSPEPGRHRPGLRFCLAQRGAQAHPGAVRGRLHRGHPNQARSIRLAGALRRPEVLEIPVLGQVAAGRPIGPDVDIHEQLMLDAHLFSRTPPTC